MVDFSYLHCDCFIELWIGCWWLPGHVPCCCWLLTVNCWRKLIPCR